MIMELISFQLIIERLMAGDYVSLIKQIYLKWNFSIMSTDNEPEVVI